MMGRPRIPINYDTAQKLAQIQCTIAEIASVLGVSDTKLKRDAQFRTIYEKERERGRMSLRRIQYQKAQEGNITMLIWLGKQYLGQSDKQVVTGDLDIRKTIKELTDDELAAVVESHGSSRVAGSAPSA